MSVQRFPVGSENPEILIERIEGDLSLRGGAQNEVVVRSDDDSSTMTPTDTGVVLVLNGDAHVHVPSHSRVRIQHAEGDMLVTAIAGALVLGRVEGDIAIRGVGSLQAEQVDGDCNISSVQGDCTLNSVDGDANITNVGGKLVVGRVSDDLNVGNVRGSIRAEAHDDLNIRVVLHPECTYALRAGGDLNVRMQRDASATLHLEAGGALNLRRIESDEPIQGKKGRIILGDGEAAVTLTAGGDLNLHGLSVEELGEMTTDWGLDMGLRVAETVQQFATQFESQLGTLARQFDAKLSEMGSSEEIATRIQEQILNAARAAEAKINEAMGRMEQRQRGPGQHGPGPHGPGREGRGQPWPNPWVDPNAMQDVPFQRGEGPRGGPGPLYTRRGWGGPPRPPAPPMPPTPPVGENERMMVLKMVSEGKISVEQAEQLLVAMGGQSSTQAANDSER
jgi:hypothetical protein